MKNIKEKINNFSIKYKKTLSLLDKKDQKKLYWVYLAGFFNSFFEFAGIGIILPLLVALLDPTLISENKTIKYLLENFSPLRGENLLIFSAGLIILVYIFKNIYSYLYNVYVHKFTFNIFNTMSLRLFKNYLFAPYEYLLDKTKSNILHNINAEVNTIVNEFLISVIEMIKVSLIIIMTLVFLFVIDFSSFFILIITILSSIYLFNRFTKNTFRKVAQEKRKYEIKKINFFIQALSALKETKILGKQNFFLNSVVDVNKNIIKNSIKTVKLDKVRVIFFELVLIVLTSSLIIFMTLSGQPSNEIVIKMSVFVVSAMRLLPHALNITNLLNVITGSNVSVDAILKDINMINKNLLKDNSKIRKFRKQITFEKVSFKYEKSEDMIIKDIDLEIKKGDQVAVVGVSGAGKTTLVDIIIGLLKPVKGNILVDGKSIIKKSDVWSYKIGYVPQDIYITNDTVLKNIAFGKEKDFDYNRVNKILKIVQLYDFVHSLDKGLESEIGEAGVKISGGQRQRLGIARALYHSPEILVMDEATSALDNKTEKKFIDTLKMMPKSVTIIMIAHRLTTVAHCNKVLFMHRGKIIKQGPFAEIKKDKLFRKEVLGELIKEKKETKEEKK